MLGHKNAQLKDITIPLDFYVVYAVQGTSSQSELAPTSTAMKTSITVTTNTAPSTASSATSPVTQQVTLRGIMQYV